MRSLPTGYDQSGRPRRIYGAEAVFAALDTILASPARKGKKNVGGFLSASRNGRCRLPDDRAFPFRETRLAGTATKHASGVVRSIMVAHRQVSGPSLAMVRTLGILTARAGKVVHDRSSMTHLLENKPLATRRSLYHNTHPACHISRTQGKMNAARKIAGSGWWQTTGRLKPTGFGIHSIEPCIADERRVSAGSPPRCDPRSRLCSKCRPP